MFAGLHNHSPLLTMDIGRQKRVPRWPETKATLRFGELLVFRSIDKQFILSNPALP